MTSKMTFTSEEIDNDRVNSSQVIISGEVISLDDALDASERFLTACGYQFPGGGQLQYITDKQLDLLAKIS